MRIILEGGVGVGKTTLAKALSLITALPVYRPFRGKADHISKRTMYEMQDIGIQVNGWQEDMYVADLLAGTNVSVILDRSMPSAMAYDDVLDSRLLPRNRRNVLMLWAERIVASRTVLVLVECDEQQRQLRSSPDRGGVWEVEGISAAIHEVASINPQLQIWGVNTTTTPPEALALAIARRVMFGTSSGLVHTLCGGVDRPMFLDA